MKPNPGCSNAVCRDRQARVRHTPCRLGLLTPRLHTGQASGLSGFARAPCYAGGCCSRCFGGSCSRTVAYGERVEHLCVGCVLAHALLHARGPDKWRMRFRRRRRHRAAAGRRVRASGWSSVFYAAGTRVALPMQLASDASNPRRLTRLTCRRSSATLWGQPTPRSTI